MDPSQPQSPEKRAGPAVVTTSSASPPTAAPSSAGAPTIPLTGAPTQAVPDSASASASAQAGALAPGVILGDRYRIARLLGRGGMGEVWRAWDLKLQVDVALKAVRAGLFPGDEGLELLRREVRAAREVMSPNVCRIFDLVIADGAEFVSMEYIDGQTLIARLRDRGALELPEATRVAAQFLAGLEAIHQAGLVHRDVKPENIMITRTGRVVLMDFGIAKGMAEGDSGTISGTPAYMAPEQMRGGALDARADIYAAGIVLAEMIAPQDRDGSTSREAILHGVRLQPPQLFDSPWRRVLERAVAPVAADRFASAGELARALEEIALRVQGAEDKRPYPGLQSFSADDAEFFFGREIEVEQLWTKLQRANLLAIVGASGAGKSSLLHAGLIPAAPPGWRLLVIRPGAAPFAALGQALVPELVGDVAATQALVHLEDTAQALFALGRWRAAHEQALIVVDQFEELFTLCRPEVQAGFADLLGRLAGEADVHVLLSLRDDFLLRCNEHPRLAPVFADLTPLGPLAGSGLRRALVQPALLCGYRFEDDALADAMLDAVTGERGALPLLAFTASELWERRDPERGVLTRAAYEEIGGVTGAMARHAEATLERIGEAREPIVREMFRNLVTAQGTRAVTELDELLSVFPDREAAAAVVRELVSARLLTTFETAEEGGVRRRRIEVVHEALLAQWPRLVRWQTQDADSAQFRDQLRKQARLWEERGRPDDLLWGGSSYQEYVLWRRRYPGGLTAGEEAFARAMIARAEHQRRRRRQFLAGTMAALVVVAVSITLLWLRAQGAQRVSEASRLNALARLEMATNPSAALAYALASVERNDTPAARQFALEILETGSPGLPLMPDEFALPGDSLRSNTDMCRLAWSPDGRWLAQACYEEAVRVWAREGGAPLVLRAPDAASKDRGTIGFSPDGSVLACLTADRKLRSWSLPEGRLLRTVEVGPEVRLDFLLPHILLSSPVSGTAGLWKLEAVSYVTGDVTPLGQHRLPANRWWMFDRTGGWVMFAQGEDLYLVPAESLETARPRFVGRHPGAVGARLNLKRGLLASWDLDPGMGHVFAIRGDDHRPLWTFAELQNDMPGSDHGMVMDPDGRWITSPGGTLYSLEAPAGVLSPSSVRFRDIPGLASGAGVFWEAFHPEGRWLAVGTDGGGTTIYPIHPPKTRVLYAHDAAATRHTFTPDGRAIVSTGMDGTLRLWSLERGPHEGARVVGRFEGRNPGIFGLAISRDGKWACAGAVSGRVLVASLDGESTQEFEAFRGLPAGMAISDEGRYVAAYGGVWGNAYADEMFIRVWDRATGAVRVLDPGERKMPRGLLFLPNGRLLSGSQGGLRLWNIEDGTHRLLRTEEVDATYVSLIPLPDGRSIRCVLLRPDRPEGAEQVVWNWQDDTWQHFVWGSKAINPQGTRYWFAKNGVLYVGRVRRLHPDRLESVLEPAQPAGPFDPWNSIAVEFSPDGKTIVGGNADGSICIVDVPEDRPVLETLPRREFLARMYATVNTRAVKDKEDFKFEIGPFPGWQTMPEW